MDYTFNEHKHNFAIWTASRAVQRGFEKAKTENIRNAINSTELLKNFSKNSISEGFDNFHRKCAKELIINLKANYIEATYGQAAKIIAIYLKTTVILCNKGEGELCDVIHPPIDRILLKNIVKKYPELKSLKDENWTELNENHYWILVEKLRCFFKRFDWTIEKDWNV